MTQIVYRPSEYADFEHREYAERIDALVDFNQLRDELTEGGILILTHKDSEPLIAYPPLSPVDADDYGYRHEFLPVVADLPAESRLRHDFADGMASVDSLLATVEAWRFAYVGDDAREELMRAAGHSHERFLVAVLCRFFVVGDLTTIGQIGRRQDFAINKTLEALILIGQRYPSLADAVAAERADFETAQKEARRELAERNELQAKRLRIHDDALDVLMSKVEPGDTGMARARGYERFVSVVKVSRRRVTVEYELMTTGEAKLSSIGPMDVEWSRRELSTIVSDARKAIKDARL